MIQFHSSSTVDKTFYISNGSGGSNTAAGHRKLQSNANTSSEDWKVLFKLESSIEVTEQQLLSKHSPEKLAKMAAANPPGS